MTEVSQQTDTRIFCVRMCLRSEDAARLEARLEADLSDWPVALSRVTVDPHTQQSWLVEVLVFVSDGPSNAAVPAEFAADPTEAVQAKIDAAMKDCGLKTSRTSGWLEKVDWVADVLARLGPVRAGRFMLYGAHDRMRMAASRFAIEVEAGLAFGTGHHPTTVSCLRAIDAFAKRGVRPVAALDLGTGTGVLAAALARVTGARIVASDIDPEAVRVAGELMRAEGLASRVSVVCADGLNHPIIRHNAPYDIVTANILSGPLKAMMPALAAALAPGGTLLLSGLLDTEAAGLIARVRSVGLTLARRNSLDGWTTLLVSNPRSGRRKAR